MSGKIRTTLEDRKLRSEYNNSYQITEQLLYDMLRSLPKHKWTEFDENHVREIKELQRRLEDARNYMLGIYLIP